MASKPKPVNTETSNLDNTGSNPGISPRPVSNTPFNPDIVLNSVDQNLLLEIDSLTPRLLGSRGYRFTYFDDAGDPVVIDGYGKLSKSFGPKAQINFLSGKNAWVNVYIFTAGPNRGRGQASIHIGTIGQPGYQRWTIVDLDTEFPA